MNLSKAITHLKMQLGLYAIALPFKDSITGLPVPIENVIRDVLVNMTIPMYSQFKPWIRTTECSITRLKVINRRSNIYMLPAEITTTPVMYIRDVRLPHNSRGINGDISTQSHGISRSVQGVITMQAQMMLHGQARSEPTFEYLGENKVALFGYPRTILIFEVVSEHEPNGETIKPSCYASFMELATLDVKIFLYNTLKLYDNISTAFGNIQLKIEEFQSADSERTAWLDKTTDIFHLDMGDERFM